MNNEWALAQLNKFAELTAFTPGNPCASDDQDEQVQRQWVVVECILDRVTPEWREDAWVQQPGSTHWQVNNWVIRAQEFLKRQQELDENLGDGVPLVVAPSLHPWVWSAASSQWRSGHFRSAVEDAVKKVNAETQNKVGRRDIGETKLFQEAFSEKPAEPGKVRLRRMKPDGSDTYKSMQLGALALAQGIFAGIRNPFNHEEPQDIDEQVALEYLAALSVLARWVDESEVETSS